MIVRELWIVHCINFGYIIVYLLHVNIHIIITLVHSYFKWMCAHLFVLILCVLIGNVFWIDPRLS